MQKLTEQDRFWITRRMPHDVWQLLLHNKHKLFLAGGFVRDCISNDKPSDIDIFAGSQDFARMVSTRMVSTGTGLRMIETENAFTVLGGQLPVQFIHRWTFENPAQCVASFDFTIARAAVWIGDEQDSADHAVLSTACDDRFYSDLAAKRLVYCSPVRNEDAGGSMLRVLKFYQRGYRIPLDSLGAVMARMAVAINADRLHGAVGGNDEEKTATVLTGMLREVDPNLDPHHLAHLPSIRSPQ